MFFLDFFGNRLLIAAVASIHVFINHALAVGIYPLLVLIEWWGWRQKSEAWDHLAYKLTFVVFIVTTSLGALTGVGIWLTTALIAPFGIGSLLRVFFWVWFSEWLVFVSEVVLVLIYFLTWKRWHEGISKNFHIALGVFLSVFSWFTMAFIVAILGFMMDSGKWPVEHSLASAFANPLYLPQLFFRTTYAVAVAGLCVWFLLFFFTDKGSALRHRAVRLISICLLAVTPFFIASSLWYWHDVPKTMLANINVALLTIKFASWHTTLAIIMAATIGAIILVAIIGVIKARMIPGVLLLLPFILGLWLLGHFERVREFIRKPYVIADYMYSNGVRVGELPVYQRDGILPYATYVTERTVTSKNMVAAGKDVFLVACSRCHTTNGVNSIVRKFRNLYGTEPWDEAALTAFIHTMHVTRTFMPPFPGNDKEAEALVAYLKQMQMNPEMILDAQVEWTPKPPAAAVAQPSPASP